ncbi:MAG TPA: PP2C family protein-serine/threonine phosphatase [Thermoanaerobaculia bacterium]|nr:PP2C family protein-serine/threonine phosphatase [Thermoanaerobaculia bacterium]
MSARSRPRLPRAALGVGALLLVAGFFAALRVLPEWRAPNPRPSGLIEKARAIAVSAGGTLSRASLALEGRPEAATTFERAYRRLRRDAAPYLESTGGAMAWTVEGSLDVPKTGTGPAEFAFSPDGSLQAFQWRPAGSLFEADPKVQPLRRAFFDRIEAPLAAGQSRVGSEFEFSGGNAVIRVRPLVPPSGGPPECIVLSERGNVLFSASRQLSDPDAPRRFNAEGITRQLYRFLPRLLLFLLVVTLFGVLLYKRRLGFRIGIALVLLAAVYEIAAGLGDDANVGSLVGFVIAVRIFLLLYFLGLWTVAESLLRDTVPGFTTSLDAFAAGRLGPRGGRAILAGLGGGAALVGVSLLAFSAAALAAPSGVWPSAPSFPYPLFQAQKGPFFEGAFDTALFALFVALFRFVVPRRFASVAAAVLFGLYSSVSMPLHPWGAAFALSLAFAAVLLWAFDRYGLAALLVAAVSSALLRDALVACMHLDGNLLAALLTVGPLLAIATAGAVGLARPERDEEGRLEAPHYVRRLESERRVKYEMDLLSRMQLSQLPEKPPAVAGLELSVKTILATEAGGDLYDFVRDESGALWIAAGDVSGHGYSCGIQQAMVMAALSSLVKAGQKPSEILVEIDRVLRMGRSARLFTSVALLRLDPASGAGLLANAGHPFPILLHEGKTFEVVGSGLPLGQGPKRTYVDVPVEIPKGGVLVLASDGLFEGPDRFDVPYGFERPRTILESTSLWRRPPDSIIEALLADWRLHVGEGPPSDDTTILVVKRPLF